MDIQERLAAAGTMTRRRYAVVLMLFITVTINYLDRANMSLAAPSLRAEFHLGAPQLGLLLAGFGWSYVLFQIPGGLLVDRVKPRYLYAAAISLWSLATLFAGLAGGLAALMVARLAVGVFEAPSYPMNNRIVSYWLPDAERAGAIAVYTSGQYVGLAFLAPVLMAVQAHAGWRAIFFLTGGLGIVWAVIWAALYRDPRDSKGVSSNELAHIAAGGGLVAGGAKPRFNKADFALVLGRRKLWGLYVGQFCLTSTQWFFLTWFPDYLVHARHMSFIKAGFFGSIPFIAAFCGVLCGGFFSDFLLRRGVSLGNARRIPIVAGFLVSTVIIGANYGQTTALVMGCLTLAFFGNGFASQTWALVSAIAPRRCLGLTGSVFNVFGNLPGIVVPLVVGLLVHGGNFAPALQLIAALALLGAFSYVVLVGRAQRVGDEQLP
jgi:ACS family D-galactonate transporter-like MFS transporter